MLGIWDFLHVFSGQLELMLHTWNLEGLSLLQTEISVLEFYLYVFKLWKRDI